METSGACYFDAYADDGFAIVGVIFFTEILTIKVRIL